MNQTTYRALVVRGNLEQGYKRAVEEVSIADLPAGEVLVRVHYSSLNYKDGLSAIGNKGVTRKFPHTPGIDAAGVVEASTVDLFAVGDDVLCMGYDLGMNTPGGFAQYIRVPAKWVLAKPDQLSLYETMQIGTAGFTAAQCVDRLLHFGVQTDQGPILVTGATGGVGSIAVALLSGLGFEVTGVTGKKSEHSFLLQLGCTTILNRLQATGRPAAAILKECWAGVVDTVGGEILATAIKSTRYNGVVTCCGNAASGDLPLTVYPFILRGVSLVGIDSANCPMARRCSIWQQLAGSWRLDMLDRVSSCISLDQVSRAIDEMLAGKIRGRMVVDLGVTA
ncbi:MAG: YhdH/YhfP family quinone oxidoreductase [Deltaproteobacteria bacterium]|nr:YhdH/YhfP family quinone oxidoreductase [Deltaproteobacteria bacterium]